MEKYDRQATDENITWRMRFAFLITGTRIQTHYHNPFLRQQFLLQHTTMLHRTYIATLVRFVTGF